jgi:isochorismate hydrolase
LLPQTTANDSSHVPKSQRSCLMIWMHQMTAWFAVQWAAPDNIINNVQITCQNRRKICKHKRVAMVLQLPPENKHNRQATAGICRTSDAGQRCKHL